MSRSYKKSPIWKEGMGDAKNASNRLVRRTKTDIANGGAYKKPHNAGWNIPYRWYKPCSEHKMEMAMCESDYMGGIRDSEWLRSFDKRWYKMYRRK